MDKLLSRETKKERPFTCLTKGIKKGMPAKAEWMRETDVLTALRNEQDSASTRKKEQRAPSQQKD